MGHRRQQRDGTDSRLLAHPRRSAGLDNDDLRRGRPTCHKVFAEAIAILAGDALLTLGFQVLAQSPPTKRLAGPWSASSQLPPAFKDDRGQAADILYQRTNPEREKVEFIHTNKTAKLMSACCRIGAICARATSDEMLLLGDYGLQLALRSSR